MSLSFGSAASILHGWVAEGYLMFACTFHSRRRDGPEPPIQIELCPHCAHAPLLIDRLLKSRTQELRAATPARALNA